MYKMALVSSLVLFLSNLPGIAHPRHHSHSGIAHPHAHRHVKRPRQESSDGARAVVRSAMAWMQPGGTQEGLASFYGYRFAGRRTASGERFHADRLSAAHRTLPLHTKIRATVIATGKSVVLTINDRGPYVGRRILDLSEAAARVLGILHTGVVPVRIEVLSLPS